MRFLYHCYARTGSDRLVWRYAAGSLRILCYHGVCEDRLESADWMPQFFVTLAQFRDQLEYLRRHAVVLPLGEAAGLLRDGRLPARAVSLTFDDGYANNLHLAYPLLREYGMPASIFISSAYAQSGELFPFLKLKLLKLAFPEADLPEYKSSPLDEVVRAADRAWADRRCALTAEQRAALRPLTAEEIGRFDSRLVEIGSHTHTHTILRNESRSRRDREIRESMALLAKWTGRPIRLFSYPNGQAADFDDADKQVLRDEGIGTAVSGIAGANRRASDPLALRRYPLGIYHDRDGFRAEVTGFRSALRAVFER